MRLVRAKVEPWLEKLRSGKYKQTKGQLVSRRGEIAFCCLGVAICDESGFTLTHTMFREFLKNGEVYNLGILRDSERSELGLSWERQDSLMRMNDGGCSFLEIADTIEQWLEEDEKDA